MQLHVGGILVKCPSNPQEWGISNISNFHGRRSEKLNDQATEQVRGGAWVPSHLCSQGPWSFSNSGRKAREEGAQLRSYAHHTGEPAANLGVARGDGTQRGPHNT